MTCRVTWKDEVVHIQDLRDLEIYDTCKKEMINTYGEDEWQKQAAEFSQQWSSN